MEFKLSKIRPNPFRHLETYPIKPDKVAALVASIEQTGFWDNVVGRLAPDGGEEAECAYGHHRLEAARKAMGEDAVIDLIIKDLDDETMIKVMANENMNEWGTSAVVEQETIRAVVEAFAAGQIKLDPPNQKTKTGFQYAPSYQSQPMKEGDYKMAYTEATVARFLGWVHPSGQPHNKVHNAIDALALIEEKILNTEDFAELGTTQAEVVIEQTKKRQKAPTSESPAQKKRAATRVGRGVAQRLREGTSTTKIETHAAAADIAFFNPRSSSSPSMATNYDELVERFIQEVAGMLAQHSRLMKGLKEVSTQRAEVDPDLLKRLSDHVRKAVARLSEIAEELEPPVLRSQRLIAIKGTR